MKLLIVSALICLMGCSSLPDSKENADSFDTTNTRNGWYEGSNGTKDNPTGCSAFRVVTVWVDGVATPRLQPVLCNQGPNFNVGDPGPDRGDPNPWELNKSVKVDQVTQNFGR